MIRPTTAPVGADGGRDPLAIEVTDEQDAEPVDVGTWEALVRMVLASQAIIGPAELAVTFVDRATMAELNAEHMGQDGPTDVLAFPVDGCEPDFGGGTGPGVVPTMLGDVIICPEVAARNAPAHAGTYPAELALLITHGILHLLGHDHAEPEETVAMQAEEQRVLASWDGGPS